MIKYLIAFAGKPSPNFVDTLRNLSSNDGVLLRAALVVPGPGCHNLAIMLDEPNEAYVNSLTMALMPAKWQVTEDPLLVEGLFEVRPE